MRLFRLPKNHTFHSEILGDCPFKIQTDIGSKLFEERCSKIDRNNYPIRTRKRGFFLYIFWRAIECVGHSLAYVAHFVFLGDVWIRTRELPQQAGALPTQPPISQGKVFLYEESVTSIFVPLVVCIEIHTQDQKIIAICSKFVRSSSYLICSKQFLSSVSSYSPFNLPHYLVEDVSASDMMPGSSSKRLELEWWAGGMNNTPPRPEKRQCHQMNWPKSGANGQIVSLYYYRSFFPV